MHDKDELISMFKGLNIAPSQTTLLAVAAGLGYQLGSSHGSRSLCPWTPLSQQASLRVE